VAVDPKQTSPSLCSLSAGFDFTGYAGDTRQVRLHTLLHRAIRGKSEILVKPTTARLQLLNKLTGSFKVTITD